MPRAPSYSTPPKARAGANRAAWKTPALPSSSTAEGAAIVDTATSTRAKVPRTTLAASGP